MGHHACQSFAHKSAHWGVWTNTIHTNVPLSMSSPIRSSLILHMCCTCLRVPHYCFPGWFNFKLWCLPQKYCWHQTPRAPQHVCTSRKDDHLWKLPARLCITKALRCVSSMPASRIIYLFKSKANASLLGRPASIMGGAAPYWAREKKEEVKGIGEHFAEDMGTCPRRTWHRGLNHEPWRTHMLASASTSGTRRYAGNKLETLGGSPLPEEEVLRLPSQDLL